MAWEDALAGSAGVAAPFEARAARAAQLTFDADEAKRQQARVHVQLHQKVITWQALRSLIDEINLREKTIIDRLMRQYGNLVFDTFHKQTDVYNQRRQAWLDVFIDWEPARQTVRSKGPPDRLARCGHPQRPRPAPIGPIPEMRTFVNEHPPAKNRANQPAGTAAPAAAAGSDKLPPNVGPNQPAETLMLQSERSRKRRRAQSGR